MTTVDTVRAALAGWPAPRLDAGSVVVPTHCLYPSNGIVHVYVEGGLREFVVHDNGDAYDQLHSMGGHEPVPGHLIRAVVRQNGLLVSDRHSIYLKDVDEAGLAGAIALVANGAKEAAEYLISRHRPAPRRPIKDELEAILTLRFPTLWRREEVFLGGSNKQHRFDYTVDLGRKGKLLMDIAKPEPSSINAAVVAHLDVRQGKAEHLVQRIVFDDHDHWTSENLSLLGVGAIPIPLSVANDALARLAA